MKKLSELTIKEVETELHRLAKNNPNFVYNPSGEGNCYYTKGHSRGPKCNGCIFGQAFQNLGVSKEELEGKQISVERLWMDAKKESCPDHWGDIQSSQDTGYSWGEIFESEQHVEPEL